MITAQLISSRHRGSDESAQYEIRQYAIAIEGIVAERFPRTWRLFSGVVP